MADEPTGTEPRTEPRGATPGATPGDDFARAARERQTHFLAEFWQFTRQNTKWWLTPILVVLLRVGVLVLLGSTGAGPLIYTLF